MDRPSGITIEGIHTSEWGLKITKMNIPFPDVREELITVPGMSGVLDATDTLTGYPTYGQREGLEFYFKYYGDWIEFEGQKSKIAALIHGKKVKMVLDSDQAHYYLARLSVNASKEKDINADFVISGSADPMKYEITSSDEDWLWDSLDFEDGVIRELADIEVSGETEVTILAGDYSVSPTFKVTESINLAVMQNGYTYPLAVGNTKIPSIRVGDEDVTLTFTGQGKLSISYRGEVL